MSPNPRAPQDLFFESLVRERSPDPAALDELDGTARRMRARASSPRPDPRLNGDRRRRTRVRVIRVVAVVAVAALPSTAGMSALLAGEAAAPNIPHDPKRIRLFSGPRNEQTPAQGPYYVTALLPEAVVFTCDDCGRIVAIAFVPPPAEPLEQRERLQRAA